MNLKLKAFLLTIVYVTAPFVFLYVMFVYPLLVLFAVLALVVYLVYNAVLENLKRDYYRKHGYTLKEFDKEFGDKK